MEKVRGPAPMRRAALLRRTDPIDVEEEENEDDDIVAVVFAKTQGRHRHRARHSTRLTNVEERIGR